MPHWETKALCFLFRLRSKARHSGGRTPYFGPSGLFKGGPPLKSPLAWAFYEPARCDNYLQLLAFVQAPYLVA